MENIKDRIGEAWAHEQEILDVIHHICIEHNLQYSLFFGTLLGAVRHGGFIPWDDDIDIIMPRADYEKLLSIWNDVAPAGYLLQNKRTDPDFTQNLTKIRKDHTTFIQVESEKNKKYHTGVFVDIFPAERVAPRGIKRTLQYIASALNLLCARGRASGTKGVVGIIEKLVLILPKTAQLRLYHRTERFVARWSHAKGTLWCSPNTIKVCKRYFDTNLFDDMTTITFNGREYCCVRDTDKVLTKIYGDYMQLPPKEKRVWTHHPILIDFEHNYSEIIAMEGNEEK